MNRRIERILVTGAAGQIGSELTLALRERYGGPNVIASDLRPEPAPEPLGSGPYEVVDVTDEGSIERAVRKHDIDTIFHMAAILSAVGERDPGRCWDVNVGGTRNVLEAGRRHEMARIVIPSSIAAFGPGAPLERTPQETVLRPTTMYGITKVCGELLADDYVRRFGLDVRGLRYPGIISHRTPPGGGTTDYAVEIYFEAVARGRYTCFVREDTRLPMMYMPDAVRATLLLAEADGGRLEHHADFNVAAMSFSAGELAASIRGEIPGFEVVYEPDGRQEAADSWPRSIDDSAARREWGWSPEWDLESMTRDMLEHLRERKARGALGV